MTDKSTETEDDEENPVKQTQADPVSAESLHENIPPVQNNAAPETEKKGEKAARKIRNTSQLPLDQAMQQLADSIDEIDTDIGGAGESGCGTASRPGQQPRTSESTALHSYIADIGPNSTVAKTQSF